MVIVISEKENTSNSIIVSGCTFQFGFSYNGGGIQATIIPEPGNCLYERTPTNLICIMNTSILSNTAYWAGGGLYARLGALNRSCHQNHLQLRETLFDKNLASAGGHAFVANSNSYAHFLVEIQGCVLRDGKAVRIGGGLYLSLAGSVLGMFLTSNFENQSAQNASIEICIVHTLFNGNIAGAGGGMMGTL